RRVLPCNHLRILINASTQLLPQTLVPLSARVGLRAGEIIVQPRQELRPTHLAKVSRHGSRPGRARRYSPARLHPPSFSTAPARARDLPAHGSGTRLASRRVLLEGPQRFCVVRLRTQQANIGLGKQRLEDTAQHLGVEVRFPREPRLQDVPEPVRGRGFLTLPQLPPAARRRGFEGDGSPHHRAAESSEHRQQTASPRIVLLDSSRSSRSVPVTEIT